MRFETSNISIYRHPPCKVTNCGEQTVALPRGVECTEITFVTVGWRTLAFSQCFMDDCTVWQLCNEKFFTVY